MYRQTQTTLRTIQTIQDLLRTAIGYESTRDMSGKLGAAQQATVQAKAAIEESLHTSGHVADTFGEPDVNATLVRAAGDVLSVAITTAERIALASNPAEMRQRIFDFKTQIDYADAYIRAAIGGEEG